MDGRQQINEKVWRLNVSVVVWRKLKFNLWGFSPPERIRFRLVERTNWWDLATRANKPWAFSERLKSSALSSAFSHAAHQYFAKCVIMNKLKTIKRIYLIILVLAVAVYFNHQPLKRNSQVQFFFHWRVCLFLLFFLSHVVVLNRKMACLLLLRFSSCR